MTKKLSIYLEEDLAARIEAAASEAGRNQQQVVREVLQYFLDAWLAGERAKLEGFRQMVGQMEVRGKKR